MAGRIIARLALLAAVLTACAPATESATGLVVDVASSGPASVDGFVLRTVDGRMIDLRVGPAAGTFSAPHLREHLVSGEPIRVTYRSEGDARIVVRLEDAAP